MLLVARKNLFSEKVRLAISVGGVALSVFLIGVLLSLYRGWSEQVGDFVEEVPADLWVVSDGTTDFIAAGSVLPDSLGTQLKFVPEIDEVSPLVVRPMEMYRSGDDPENTFDIQLVGYDPKVGLGGPLRIVDGKSPPGPDEIVIDEATRDRYDVQIGDKLVRGIKSLTVVGVASGGDFVYTQVAHVTLDTAIEFLNLEPQSVRTFFVITLHDPSERDAVAQRLALGLPGVKFVEGEVFADETRDRILSNILPILIVVLIIAFIVGLAVAGLTIYTATVEKAREYGILKAEGFTNPYLYRVVFEQSIVTGVLGFLVGAGLTLIIAPFAEGSRAAVRRLRALAGHPRYRGDDADHVPTRCLHPDPPADEHRSRHGVQRLTMATATQRSILRLEGVSKIYRSGEFSIRALDNANLLVSPGELVAVMGPSGSGKTTLLTIAGALLKPTEGTVHIGDIDVTSLGESKLAEVRRHKVGFIYQSFNLLEALTAVENVRVIIQNGVVKKAEATEKARGLLEMFGLGHRINSLPKKMSDGEKQRVAIARALAKESDLILADEPTANLDAKRGQEVMRLLRDTAIQMERGVVVVSHDDRIRQFANRVVWLEDGRLSDHHPD